MAGLHLDEPANGLPKPKPKPSIALGLACRGQAQQSESTHFTLRSPPFLPRSKSKPTAGMQHGFSLPTRLWSGALIARTAGVVAIQKNNSNFDANATPTTPPSPPNPHPNNTTHPTPPPPPPTHTHTHTPSQAAPVPRYSAVGRSHSWSPRSICASWSPRLSWVRTYNSICSQLPARINPSPMHARTAYRRPRVSVLKLSYGPVWTGGRSGCILA